MVQVDPDDDTLQRFVLQHYRFDPERRQRRRVTVAAFDDYEECESARQELQAGIDRRRASGERVDPRERATMTGYRPGDQQRAAHARLLSKAFAHGVDQAPLIEEGDIPPGKVLLRLHESESRDEK